MWLATEATATAGARQAVFIEFSGIDVRLTGHGRIDRRCFGNRVLRGIGIGCVVFAPFGAHVQAAVFATPPPAAAAAALAAFFLGGGSGFAADRLGRINGFAGFDLGGVVLEDNIVVIVENLVIGDRRVGH